MIYCSIDCETTGLNREICQILEIGVIIEDCSKPRPFEELPKLKLVIDRRTVVGEPYAINMNARIFRLLSMAMDIKDSTRRYEFKRDNNIVTEDDAVRMMWEFLYINGFGDNYTVRVSEEELHQNTARGISNAGLTYDQAMIMADGNVSKIDMPKPNKRGQLKVNAAGKNFGTFDKVFLEKLPGFTDLIRFRQRVLDPSTSYADFINDEESPSMDKCFSRLSPLKEYVVAHDSIMDAWDVICLLRPLYDTYSHRLTNMRASKNAPGLV